MLNQVIVQKLKQNNISADAEKTKVRATEIWKSASRENQNTILSLAGVARTTVQRAYKTGSISAKLVVPMSQVLNISPFYLTGEADEMDECSLDLIKELLIKHKYDKLLPEFDKDQRKQSRKPRKSTVIASIHDAADEDYAPAMEPDEITPDMQEFLDAMTEDDMIMLLRSILLRAKAGGKHAAAATELKRLLLS